jgi:membrane dipeptidase
VGAQFGFPIHAMFYGPMGQYDLPRLQEGGVTAQLCAIYIEDHELSWSLQRGLQMAWNFHHMVETTPGLEKITSAADIRRIKQAGTNGAILTLEGFDAVGDDIRMLDLYYKLGLRVGSLTHVRRNMYADGSYAASQPGGLTNLGKNAIRRMNELGIVVDLVHLHEIGVWEVLDITTAPVILSHSTSTMFPAVGGKPGVLGVPRPQLVPQRDRPILEALAKNGGVLGIIWFYKADLESVVADIETALELMGEDHVGVGSDLYGLGLAPAGLETIGKMPALTRRLVERGHSDDVILKVLGGNFLRVFEQVWR